MAEWTFQRVDHGAAAGLLGGEEFEADAAVLGFLSWLDEQGDLPGLVIEMEAGHEPAQFPEQGADEGLLAVPHPRARGQHAAENAPIEAVHRPA